MKKLLIGILTIFVTLGLILLGVSLNLKATVTEVATNMINEEVTNTMTDYLEKNTDVNKNEIKKGIDKVVNSNDTIKKAVNNYYSEFMDILSDKEFKEINIASELEILIDNSEPILKEYGITISKKDKEELTKIVSNEEINKTVNESIKEVKKEMPGEVTSALNILNFITSTTFKIILIGTIILSLVLIALLKKSIYKWLINLGIASILCGLLYSIVIPIVFNILSKEIDAKIKISASALNNYGYVVLALGILTIILNMILSKILNKKIIVSE